MPFGTSQIARANSATLHPSCGCCCGCANVCVQTSILACAITTTCMCLTDTCLVITIANRPCCGGSFFISHANSVSQNTFQNIITTIADDGTAGMSSINTLTTGLIYGQAMYRSGSLNGSVMRVRWRVPGGIGTMRAGSNLVSFEVGGT